MDIEWIQEHFFHILGGGAALFVLHWLYRHSGRLFQRHVSANKSKVFCKHCNWEGYVKRNKLKCKRCGDRNVNVLV